ncbi:MAG: double-stranded DNA-binding protein [Nitrosopumilaceae archaeon]|nr:double-stranded DNA-binding protein [Nitrosopumilaceae archaeon]
MSEDDRDLEALKLKRLAEMQKNISYKKKQEDIKSLAEEKKKNKPSARDVVVKQLGYRGLEVLEQAEIQFSSQTKFVIEKLAELISSGEVNETIDGGKLLALFRSIGVNVRLETKINIEQDGKFVSLSDKLSKSTQSNDASES